MAASSVANAALGMAFWALAAKMFTPESLGVMTALLAVIVSVSVVVAAGVGDAYTALLPAAGPDRPRLYRHGQRLFVGMAFISGLVAAVAAISWLREVRGSNGAAALVVVGVMACSTLTLQNSTLIALGRARWLPAANVTASLLKIAFLPLLAVTWKWHAVTTSLVAAAVLMVAILRSAIVKVIDTADELPAASTGDEVSLRNFYRFVAQTALSSALSLGLIGVMPFIVTIFAGPAQGALFSLSLSIVQALDFIGASLVVSLVVHASSAPEQAAAMARSVLLRAVGLALVGGAAVVLIAPHALHLVNSRYDAAATTAVIAVLASGAVIRCTYVVWVGLQRARRKMKWPLWFNCLCAAVLLTSAPYLCTRYGAIGGGFALLLAQFALITGIGVHFFCSHRRCRPTTAPIPRQEVL